ncbi:Fig2p NDAI_0I00230 [Naumovozyma dairenensis CBS 421]|uniref:Flo11 domain-containing protein n=1 Tax=Naumovozyma dairenensis (strain ATCC 10597 / BCRC 20456 / CBS 421 / NBRC 0211 / NRRL Y-12639) TaxID=1071378 RepID=G0WFN1_NAUDC|nr:hypothetical protein NDAI_0I00230 [Naumovozyma dairenensis CBS 421]CCD26592.1 hypothetical protein NDAI_0I00230 [Naumovozyma dairenensis CBS 421]
MHSLNLITATALLFVMVNGQLPFYSNSTKTELSSSNILFSSNLGLTYTEPATSVILSDSYSQLIETSVLSVLSGLSSKVPTTIISSAESSTVMTPPLDLSLTVQADGISSEEFASIAHSTQSLPPVSMSPSTFYPYESAPTSDAGSSDSFPLISTIGSSFSITTEPTSVLISSSNVTTITTALPTTFTSSLENGDVTTVTTYVYSTFTETTCPTCTHGHLESTSFFSSSSSTIDLSTSDFIIPNLTEPTYETGKWDLTSSSDFIPSPTDNHIVSQTNVSLHITTQSISPSISTLTSSKQTSTVQNLPSSIAGIHSTLANSFNITSPPDSTAISSINNIISSVPVTLYQPSSVVSISNQLTYTTTEPNLLFSSGTATRPILNNTDTVLNTSSDLVPASILSTSNDTSSTIIPNTIIEQPSVSSTIRMTVTPLVNTSVSLSALTSIEVLSSTQLSNNTISFSDSTYKETSTTVYSSVIDNASSTFSEFITRNLTNLSTSTVTPELTTITTTTDSITSSYIAKKSTVTTVINDIITIYTTWCPLTLSSQAITFSDSSSMKEKISTSTIPALLSSIPSSNSMINNATSMEPPTSSIPSVYPVSTFQSSAYTPTISTIISKYSNTNTSYIAKLSTVTTTVKGVVTEYTTWCPLEDQSKSTTTYSKGIEPTVPVLLTTTDTISDNTTSSIQIVFSTSTTSHTQTSNSESHPTLTISSTRRSGYTALESKATSSSLALGNTDSNYPPLTTSGSRTIFKTTTLTSSSDLLSPLRSMFTTKPSSSLFESAYSVSTISTHHDILPSITATSPIVNTTVRPTTVVNELGFSTVEFRTVVRSICTTTVHGVVTEFVTWCPLTSYELVSITIHVPKTVTITTEVCSNHMCSKTTIITTETIIPSTASSTNQISTAMTSTPAYPSTLKSVFTSYSVAEPCSGEHCTNPSTELLSTFTSTTNILVSSTTKLMSRSLSTTSLSSIFESVPTTEPLPSSEFTSTSTSISSSNLQNSESIFTHQSTHRSASGTGPFSVYSTSTQLTQSYSISATLPSLRIPSRSPSSGNTVHHISGTSSSSHVGSNTTPSSVNGKTSQTSYSSWFSLSTVTTVKSGVTTMYTTWCPRTSKSTTSTTSTTSTSSTTGTTSTTSTTSTVSTTSTTSTTTHSISTTVATHTTPTVDTSLPISNIYTTPSTTTIHTTSTKATTLTIDTTPMIHISSAISTTHTSSITPRTRSSVTTSTSSTRRTPSIISTTPTTSVTFTLRSTSSTSPKQNTVPSSSPACFGGDCSTSRTPITVTKSSFTDSCSDNTCQSATSSQPNTTPVKPCSDSQCSSKVETSSASTSSAIFTISTVTTVRSGITTIYTTWCPRTGKSSTLCIGHNCSPTPSSSFESSMTTSISFSTLVSIPALITTTSPSVPQYISSTSTISSDRTSSTICSGSNCPVSSIRTHTTPTSTTIPVFTTCEGDTCSTDLISSSNVCTGGKCKSTVNPASSTANSDTRITSTVVCTKSKCQTKLVSSSTTSSITFCTGNDCTESTSISSSTLSSSLSSQFTILTSIFTPKPVTSKSLVTSSSRSTIPVTTMVPMTRISTNSQNQKVTITSSSSSVLNSITTILVSTEVPIISTPDITTIIYTQPCSNGALSLPSATTIATSVKNQPSSTWIQTPVVTTYAGSGSKITISYGLIGFIIMLFL